MIKDKVAIVTGASSGIGYATALTLSKAGAKVAIGARRTQMCQIDFYSSPKVWSEEGNS